MTTMIPTTRPSPARAATWLATILALALPAVAAAASPWPALVVGVEGGRPLGDVAGTSLPPTPPTPDPDVGRLRHPNGVAIDAAGLRYVADTEHHRIVVFDTAGAMVRTWGRLGVGPGEFQYPQAVAVDRAGAVYVADWGNLRVQRFTPDGRLLGQLGGPLLEDFEGLFSPTVVAALATGEIVVHAGAVFLFAPEGRRLRAWDIPVRTEPRARIGVDAAGHLYVVGHPGHRILKLDADGRVLATFGRGYGEGDGQLFDPIGLTVDAAGRVWVAEWVRERGRVQGFVPDGRHLGTWWAGDDGQRLRAPQAIAVDAEGRLHVADRNSTTLIVITPDLRPSRSSTLGATGPIVEPATRCSPCCLPCGGASS